jgi:hypothetical protein
MPEPVLEFERADAVLGLVCGEGVPEYMRAGLLGNAGLSVVVGDQLLHSPLPYRLPIAVEKEMARVIVAADCQIVRKLSNPALAHCMVEQVQKGALVIEEVNREIFDEALALFDPHGSKQNTLLDAIVAVVAEDYQADAVFSFDEWYRTMGLKLVSDIVQTG